MILFVKIIKQNEKEITLEYKCNYCGRINNIIVNKESFEKWKKGEANHGLSPVKEEQLISNLCIDCWE